MENSSLSKLFNPASVAVVGASQDPSKLGSVVLQNIVQARYSGRLAAINPNYSNIGDVPCFTSVLVLDFVPDLVVIVVPAAAVKQVVQDCATKGVGNAIIISAGFGETGAQGKLAEAELVEIAKSSGLRILGPNCLGISIPGFGLNASFAAHYPDVGNIAFLSQSGAINTSILDLAASTGLGFSHFISLGNKCDLNELDFLREWTQDPSVGVIGMYLEEFTDGNDFVELAASCGKPIVILRPGESVEAKRAISSHTGSMAGSTQVVQAALLKAGIMQVNSIERLFNLLMALSWGKELTGEKLAIVTNAGGPGIMVTDLAVENRISIPELSQDLQTQLVQFLPSASSVKNPIDILGDSLADRYAKVLQVLDKSSEVDSIVVLLTPQRVTQIEETAKVLIDYAQVGSKPVYPVFLGDMRVSSGISILHQSRVPCFQFAEEALAAIGKIRTHMRYRQHFNNQHHTVAIPQKKSDLEQIATPEPLPLEQEAIYKLIYGSKIVLPAEATIENLEQAQEFATAHGFPLVLKASTQDITHKTDDKAIYLDINTAQQLEEAVNQLKETVTKVSSNPNPKLLIQQQISGGEELIIGAVRDGSSDVYSPQGKGFGHLLVFGKGGIYTEVYKDIEAGLAPLSREQILDLVLQTRVSKVLLGTRGQPALAIDKLIDTLESVQQLVLEYPEIQQLDINPLILTPTDCFAVDVKIFVAK